MGWFNFAQGGGGSGGSGDVVGPASSTDNAIARYDGTTGKLLQDSALTVSDVAAGVVTLATTAGNALTIQNTNPAATTGASVAGDPLVVNAGDAVASTDTAGAAAGGSVTVQGGDAARFTSGDANGGDVLLVGGAGIGTGTQGVVKANGVNVIVGSTGATDNAIPRADGTGGSTLQGGNLYYTDTGTAPHPILQFGGETSSFPGIRRLTGSPDSLVVGLADGSNGGGLYATLYALGGTGIPIQDVNSGLNLNAATTAVNAITWWSTFSSSKDVGLRWAEAGTLRVVNGAATGTGNLLFSRLVEASTAGSGAPNVLTALENNKVLTNEGATAANYHTLPTAVAGCVFTFVCQDADGIRITANTDDTIRVIDKVTAAAGYIESTTIGSCVTLVSINAVEWYATSIKGVWTDGTFTYDDTSLTTP